MTFEHGHCYRIPFGWPSTIQANNKIVSDGRIDSIEAFLTGRQFIGLDPTSGSGRPLTSATFSLKNVGRDTNHVI